MRMTVSAIRLGLGSLLLLHPAVVTAGYISVTVADPDLPVGGKTVLQILLDPAIGPVSAAGGTVTYDPAVMAVPYAGVGPSSLGGSEDALHLLKHGEGRIVFGGSLPGGTDHVPTEPEPMLVLHLARLAGASSHVVLEDPFYLPAGTSMFQSVPSSNIIFGVISGDSDGDGILDTWEFLHFGGLFVATAVSDFDGDGVSDVDESLLGTPPRIPYLVTVPEIDDFREGGLYRVTLTLPTETLVEYRVERADSLSSPVWGGVSFATTPGGVATHEVLVGSGGDLTVEIPVWGAGPHYFRIVVDAL